MHIDYVKTPFNNNPSMQKYSGPLLIENPRKIYLDEKLTQLSEYGADLYGESKIFKENNFDIAIFEWGNPEMKGEIFEKIFTEFDADGVIGSRFVYSSYTRSHNILNKIGNSFLTLIFNILYKNTKPNLLKMITTTEVVEIAMVESKALHS